ncbi:hypothetical protein CL657_05330 [bacterium]|nr:hypothetical protein [bacterium]
MISLVGCGWLGLHLARYLSSKDIRLFGSTTRESQRELLRSVGVTPCILTVSDEGAVSYDTSELFAAATLVITLPFRRSFLDPKVYYKQIKGLLDVYTQYNSSKKRLIFTSSTSVYSLTNSMVYEDDDIIPESDRQRVLLDVEHYLLNLNNVDTTILRCAGLYGYDRRIAKFLAGKVVANKRAPVNLIHVDDMVGIFDLILNNSVHHSVFNCVVNHHPSKETLYNYYTKKEGLSPPRFADEDGDTQYKIVNNDRLVKTYHYSFKHPRLFD